MSIVRRFRDGREGSRVRILEKSYLSIISIGELKYLKNFIIFSSIFDFYIIKKEVALAQD